MAVTNVKNFSFNQRDLIGEGATGTVYKGTDTFNGKVVAIKAIKMSSINNEVTRYLLENELQALKIVDHPNVVKNYDIVKNKDFTYIVMEYCPSNLNTFLKTNKNLPEQKVLEIFQQIVEGYKALKDRRIIHRDLKPSNILLTADLIPKISDLGYCQIEGFLPKPKMFYNVGSPSYMSPEAITKNTYSDKSDIWSLGAILFEIINGETFDKGKKVMEAITNIGKKGLTFYKPVNPTIQQIVKQCLTLNPAKRIGLEQLRKLLNLEASGVRNTSFYRDDSVLPPQSIQHQFINQNTIPLQPKELQINRSNAVFKSLILPVNQYHHQDTLQIPQAYRQTIRNSIISQQIPQITTTQQTTSSVMNSLLSHPHHEVKSNVIITPVVQSRPIQPHQPIVHPVQITRSNQLLQVPRSINNLDNQSRRYASISPAKQSLVNKSLIQKKRMNLNTSISEIPSRLIPVQTPHGIITRL